MTWRFALSIWTLALVELAGALAIVLTSNNSQNKALTIAIAAPAGLAFVASGLIARAQRPANRTGALLIAVGLLWFLGALTSANSAMLFTAGLVLNNAFFAVLGYLLLAFPTGRLESRVDRGIVRGLYVFLLAGPVATYLFDEGKIAAGSCDGPSCPENLLAVAPHQNVADALELITLSGALLLAAAIIVRLTQKWRGATPALRRALAPVITVACALLGILLAGSLVSLVSDAAGRFINWLLLVAILALPLAFLFGLLRYRFGALGRRLLSNLPEDAGALQVRQALREVLRDPDLELGYRGADGYVDVHDRPFSLPGPEDPRGVTELGDEVIVHDASLLDQPALHDVVDAARIAVQRGLSIRSLEASERHRSALLDAIPDNVFRIRRDGVYLDYHVHDPAKLVVPPDEIIGRNLAEAASPEVAAQVMDAIETAIATGEVVTIEYDLRGETKEARIIRSGDDEVVTIIRDVTDRKRNEHELRALADEQAALNRVAVAVASELPPEQIFDLVTEEVGRLLDAAWASTVRFAENLEEVVIVGRWHESAELGVAVGSRMRFQGGAITRVWRTGKPSRMDFEREPRDVQEYMSEAGVWSGVAAPIVASGRLWGAVSAMLPKPRAFPEDAQERIGKFAGLVALAIANAETREQLASSRARIVLAGDDERRRLERNLHDGAQQRLVTLSLVLRLAEARLEDDPQAARELLDSAASELALALEELRELARGLHPAILSDRGLGAALAGLAERAPVVVELDEIPAERFPPPVEAAAYYVVAESLTNVAKYAQASAAHVTVSRLNGFAVVEVGDDGVGGADPLQGSGLRGLADRVEALDGHLVVTSEPGRGTRVRAEIPCS